MGTAAKVTVAEDIAEALNASRPMSVDRRYPGVRVSALCANHYRRDSAGRPSNLYVCHNNSEEERTAGVGVKALTGLIKWLSGFLVHHFILLFLISPGVLV